MTNYNYKRSEQNCVSFGRWYKRYKIGKKITVLGSASRRSRHGRRRSDSPPRSGTWARRRPQRLAAGTRRSSRGFYCGPCGGRRSTGSSRRAGARGGPGRGSHSGVSYSSSSASAAQLSFARARSISSDDASICIAVYSTRSMCRKVHSPRCANPTGVHRRLLALFHP